MLVEKTQAKMMKMPPTTTMRVMITAAALIMASATTMATNITTMKTVTVNMAV